MTAYINSLAGKTALALGIPFNVIALFFLIEMESEYLRIFLGQSFSILNEIILACFIFGLIFLIIGIAELILGIKEHNKETIHPEGLAPT